MKKLLIQVLAFAIIICSYSEPAPADLTISTFNIRWYGLKSKRDRRKANENRDKWVREYISNELKHVDAIMFQEIVDIQRLKKRVLGSEFECVSYDHSTRNHQHVVFCYRNYLKFIREQGDDNYVAEEVAINPNRSRPAVSGILANSWGQPIAHVLGVHLKAMPDHTHTRIGQTHKLADRIAGFGDNVPVIALGDFNTHPTPRNGQQIDDWRALDNIFRQKRLNLDLIKHDHPYTYRTPKRGSKFDHIWVSSHVRQMGEVEVGGACIPDKLITPDHLLNNPLDLAAGVDYPFDDIKFYYKNVSDHCPVTVTLDI